MGELKEILWVSAEAVDTLCLRKALQDAGIQNTLRVFLHPKALQGYLKKQVKVQKQGTVTPSLVLLNLDVRVESIKSFLGWLRADPVFCHLLAIGLSEAEGGPRIQELFDAGLNAYFNKGLRISGIIDLLKDLQFLQDILLRDTMPRQQVG